MVVPLGKAPDAPRNLSLRLNPAFEDCVFVDSLLDISVFAASVFETSVLDELGFGSATF